MIVVIYGVHRRAWRQVGEIDLLTAQLATAESHAQHSSADWQYGEVIVTSRELDNGGALRVFSVWRRGVRVSDYGPAGAWRKVQPSPI